MGDGTDQGGGDALATMTAERDAARADQTTAETLASEETKRADKVEARVAELEKKLDTANDKLTKAKASAPAKPTIAKARRINDDQPPADRASMAALLQFPGPFEVVPSYTGHEVTGAGAVSVTNADFATQGGQIKVIRDITFQPDQAVTIDGFALFGSDGKQVAYQALPEPVTIQAGQSVGFADAIAFATAQGDPAGANEAKVG